MFTNTSISLIGGIIILVGGLTSGIVTWFYLQRAKSEQKQHLTQREKYIHPLLAIAGSSFIVGIGMLCVFVPTASSQVTYEDGIMLIILSMSCSGCLFMQMMFSYLVNLWFHQRNAKPN